SRPPGRAQVPGHPRDPRVRTSLPTSACRNRAGRLDPQVRQLAVEHGARLGTWLPVHGPHAPAVTRRRGVTLAPPLPSEATNLAARRASTPGGTGVSPGRYLRWRCAVRGM